jgi:hypothetical protein
MNNDSELLFSFSNWVYRIDGAIVTNRWGQFRIRKNVSRKAIAIYLHRPILHQKCLNFSAHSDLIHQHVFASCDFETATHLHTVEISKNRFHFPVAPRALTVFLWPSAMRKSIFSYKNRELIKACDAFNNIESLLSTTIYEDRKVATFQEQRLH